MIIRVFENNPVVFINQREIFGEFDTVNKY